MPDYNEIIKELNTYGQHIYSLVLNDDMGSVTGDGEDLGAVLEDLLRKAKMFSKPRKED